MRYRMDPCGNNGPVAYYDIVDTHSSQSDKTVCSAPIAHARTILDALNASDQTAGRKASA